MESQTTSLYYFNIGFLVEKVLLTCDTIKSKLPLTYNELMFISMARFKPKTRDSYSTMLLVQSNSSFYVKRVASLLCDIRTTLTPDPAFECAPWKSNPQHPSLFSSSIQRDFSRMKVLLVPSLITWWGGSINLEISMVVSFWVSYSVMGSLSSYSRVWYSSCSLGEDIIFWICCSRLFYALFVSTTSSIFKFSSTEGVLLS
jgi:hypothetical protein